MEFFEFRIPERKGVLNFFSCIESLKTLVVVEKKGIRGRI